MSLSPTPAIAPQDVTGLVLAGGRATRMGGVDKGLQSFRNQPLVQHALRRLRPQVRQVAVNANRHLDQYHALGVSVWPDSLADYPGPLAGMLAGLQHCDTPYLVTVPCDSPLFPLDLVARLAEALARAGADLALPIAGETDAQGQVTVRPQPVFCLLRAELKDSLHAFVQQGGRKVGAWTAQHASVLVPFDAPQDDPLAFSNANTVIELQALEAGRPDARA